MGKMTIKEILAADLAKNYKGESASVDEYYKGFKAMVDSGTKMYRVGNTIYMVDSVDNDTIEWHTTNAERSDALLVNTNKFLKRLKADGVKTAFTYYDNPKINALVEQFDFPTEINKVNEGKYKTYKAEVSL
jgi:hypothetical protein